MRNCLLDGRILLAACTGLISACYVFARLSHASPPLPQPEPQQVNVNPESDPTDWPLVSGSGSSAVALQIATTAKSQWIAKGMEDIKATKLADDVAVVLQSVFAPDFEKYHAHMISRGCSLDAMATALTDQFIEWEFYTAATPELAPSQSIERRFAYVWNHAEERRADWSSVRLSSLAVGFGLVIEGEPSEWPYPGHYAQMSVYTPPNGRLSVTDGEAINESKDSAWLVIEGRFKNGMQTRARINFYYDNSLSNWIPLNIVFGTDGEHRPFPLL